jgi:hypothetical protein
MSCQRWRNGLLAFVLGILSGATRAAIGMSVAVDDIVGEDWRVGAISVNLNSAAAGFASLNIRVEEIMLPDGHGTLRGVELECVSLVQQEQGWRCDEGSLLAK